MNTSRLVAVCLLMGAVCSALAASPGDLDPGFTSRGITWPNFSPVKAIIQKPDGKLVVGGLFSGIGEVWRTNLAQLNEDGTLDESFFQGIGPASGPDFRVDALANYTGDRIIVGGAFSLFNGVSRPNLARLNPDGSLDAAFLSGMTGPNGAVQKVIVQSNGKVLIQGAFTKVNGVGRLNLARLNEDGSLDESFAPMFEGSSDTNPGAQSSIGSLLLLPDGRIMVGGSFLSVNGSPSTNIARLHPDGTLDTSFALRLNPPTMDVRQCLAVLPGNRILCHGDWYVYTGTGGPYPVYPLHRLGVDGAEDETFQRPGIPRGAGWVGGVVVFKTGGFVIGGAFGPVHAPEPLGVCHLAAFSEDGTFDSSFLNGQTGPGNIPLTCLMQQADGKIVLGGYFNTFNGVQCLGLARLLGEYNSIEITKDPLSQTAEIGSEVTFRVNAEGYPPPVYHWHFRGQAMSSHLATSSVLRLTSVQAEDIGDYCAVVMNAQPPLTSAPAMLSVIVPVERRAVPRISLDSQPGAEVHVEYSEATPWNWTVLDTVTLASATDYLLDPTVPTPPQRFYRAWQSPGSSSDTILGIQMVPELKLLGSPPAVLQIDYINAIGPTDAWIPLETVNLTNSPQAYFDITAPGQPRRLYRISTVP